MKFLKHQVSEQFDEVVEKKKKTNRKMFKRTMSVKVMKKSSQENKWKQITKSWGKYSEKF